jgi:hypothetical protein
MIRYNISPSGPSEKQGACFRASRIFLFRDPVSVQRKKLIFTGFTLIIQQFLFFWLATETLLSSNHKLIDTV